MKKTGRIIAIVLSLAFLVGLGTFASIPAVTAADPYVQQYNNNMAKYQKHEVPLVEGFRAQYDGSLAHRIVARSIWYMEYGYMVYGHSNYVKDGKVDCSNFVSLVFKDFGYNLTTFSSRYNNVGTKVEGVYSRLQSGSKTKYELVGLKT